MVEVTGVEPVSVETITNFNVYSFIINYNQLPVKYNLTLCYKPLNCYYALDNIIFNIACLCWTAQFSNL